MERFTKGDLKVIRVAINTALREVEEAHGISLQVGNMTVIGYKDDIPNTGRMFRTQLEGFAINENGVTESKERMDFVAFATSYGLNPEWLDKEVVVEGKTFILTGLNTKASKFPISLEPVDGGEPVKCKADPIKDYFSQNVRVKVA